MVLPGDRYLAIGSRAGDGIPESMIIDIERYREEIRIIPIKRPRLNEIVGRCHSAEPLKKARQVETGLWAIDDVLLDTMIAHAENIQNCS